MELPKELEGKARITTHGKYRYLECIDCGKKKNERGGSKLPRCFSCSAYHKNSQYNQREGFRTCKKCGEEKELNRDNFTPIKQRNSLSGECRVCCYKRQGTKEAKEKTRQRNKKPEVIERRKERAREYRSCPAVRLRHNVSSCIRKALRSNQGGKLGGSILDHLPYSIAELKEHLESQFQPGMSWKNWGKGADKWNIDHIYPHSKLPYDSMDHPNFQKAWTLSNLRPLWEVENRAKGDKIIKELIDPNLLP
jgi:hypothetical protein